jgi:hypothetical protein
MLQKVLRRRDLTGPELDLRRKLISQAGDFPRGSLNAVWRKCGKPNCACVQPGHRGHGPQWNLTRRIAASILALRTQHASGRWNDFIAPEHTPPAGLRTAV